MQDEPYIQYGKQKKWGFKQKGEKETAAQDKKKVEREW